MSSDPVPNENNEQPQQGSSSSSRNSQAPSDQQEDSQHNKGPSAIDRMKPQINVGESDGVGSGSNGGALGKPSPNNAKRGSSPSGARRGSRDLLAPAGINIERRRASSQTPSYRIEKNQVIVEGKDGSPEQRLEILEIHEKPGKFKRALPALPLAFGILFGILNFFLPGIGTLLGGIFARFTKIDSEQVSPRSQTGAQVTTSSLLDSSGKPSANVEAGFSSTSSDPPLSKKEKLNLNVVAAILQIISTPILLVGWIWSINWGIILITLSVHKRMAARQVQQQEMASENPQASQDASAP